MKETKHLIVNWSLGKEHNFYLPFDVEYILTEILEHRVPTMRRKFKIYHTSTVACWFGSSMIKNTLLIPDGRMFL